jgi:hypothetical protein
MSSKLNTGLSLIEVILGLALFSVLMITANVIMVSTLRDARKAEAVAVVKQEGGYAMSLMTSAIKFAQSVSCSGNSVTILKTDNSNYTFTLDTANKKLISSDGAITSQNVVVNPDGSCGAVFTCGINSVSICYNVETKTGIDASEKAGTSGVKFQTQVSMLNMSL